MVIQCPDCSARYRIDAAKATKSVVRVKCPKCHVGFEVNLPSTETTVASVDNPKTSGRRKVLVVDDARFFRDVVLDILQPLDVDILKAGDGEEALALIREHHPDLVILDLKLPKLDGHQLIREIRSDSQLKSIRLLAMSSVYRRDEEIRQVALAGADDFLNKSFKPEHLLQRVNRLLES